MSSQPLDINRPSYFFDGVGYYPVSHPQFPSSPLPRHVTQLPGAIVSHHSSPFRASSHEQYVRRYESVRPGQPPMAPLREIYSTTDGHTGNNGPTGLQPPQPERLRPYPSPSSTEAFQTQFGLNSQVNSILATAPLASTQTPLDLGQPVTQPSPKIHAGPPKSKHDDRKIQCSQSENILPPRRILPFPTPKKRKAQVGKPEEARRTKIIFTKSPSETGSATAQRNNPKPARTPTSPRKGGGKARASKSQTQGASKQKANGQSEMSGQPSSNPPDDHVSHIPHSHRISNKDTSGPPALPIEDIRDLLSLARPDLAKRPAHKRSASQATTVSGTSTMLSTGTARKQGAYNVKTKHSRQLEPRIKIDEDMVLEKEMSEIVNTRLRQGDANALNQLRGEIATKLLMKLDGEAFQGAIKMLES